MSKMNIIRSAELPYLPAGHEDPKSPGVLIRKLFQKKDLIQGRVPMINWALLPVGKCFRAHYHEDMQEIFVLIKGKAKITVDREEAEMNKGDAVVIPVGSVHTLENSGTEDVEYIVVGITQERGGKTVIVEKR